MTRSDHTLVFMALERDLYCGVRPMLVLGFCAYAAAVISGIPQRTRILETIKHLDHFDMHIGGV